MTNRPANANTAKKWPRAPHDWYCETPRVVEQLFHGLAAHGVSFDNDLIWDPCCGRANVLDVAKRYGHLTFGSDLVYRGGHAHPFQNANILSLPALPPAISAAMATGLNVSVISNTPYSCETNIAERVICHLLDRWPIRRAAFILPIAFLNGQDRWRGNKFAGRYRPSHTAIYRERHTMPPGHLIDQMTNPFGGGMQDYCALVFTRPHRWRTETLWLPPGHFPDPPGQLAPNQGEHECLTIHRRNRRAGAKPSPPPRCSTARL